MKTTWLPLLAALAIFGSPAHLQAAPPSALERADKLFKAQHWAEARTAYDAARDQEKDWHSPAMRRAVEGAVTSLVKLSKWNAAFQQAEDYAAHTPDAFEEIGAQRMLATLFLAAPHFGRRSGDRFLRGESSQSYDDRDIQERDRQEAIRRLERARDVAARLAARPADAAETWRPRLEAERIGVDFDLVAVLMQAPGSHGDSGAPTWWTAAPPPEIADQSEQDHDYSSWADRNMDPGGAFDEPPVGIPRQPDGKPLFLATPTAYAPTLTTGGKTLFLLTEIEGLDTSAHHDAAARATLRRAVIARDLYGPATVEGWLEWWEQNRHGAGPMPVRPVIPATRIWELGDDQALTPVGARLEVVDLPPGESPLALLDAVQARYPESAVVPDAKLARALYLQSRQQFPRALEEYRAFLMANPGSPLAKTARAEIDAVQGPGIKLDKTGVHLAGERPKLAFTARNAAVVDFTARRVDLLRYATETDKKTGQPRLFQSTAAFFQVINAAGQPDQPWQKYLDKEPTAAWSEPLATEQGSRTQESATLAPLEKPGAYVVEARVAGARQPSRLLVVVSDALLLRKTVKDGTKFSTLLLACDARTGKPLADRAVQVYEGWSESRPNGGRSKEHLDRETRVTDANGAVLYRRAHRASRLEAALAGEGGQIAFSSSGRSMDVWSNFPESDLQPKSRLCYVLTDRPVYRPGSTVHFCLWLREKKDGVYHVPAPEPVKVSLTGPGRAPHDMIVQPDANGVASGDYALEANAPLGAYDIEVGEDEDHRWETSSGSGFHVEEYRQPEFEVSVKPSTAHARLGEKFKAAIEARYYFGSPVTQGKVTYKVFRDVYGAAYFEPAEYDWLYGKGYGLMLYPYPWLPWWAVWGGRIGWGGDHPMQPPGEYRNSPRFNVHELVLQGEADLGPDGRCELEVDTARALAEQGNADHQYTIEASVRGNSRRVVEGSGSVVATRQEFAAYVEVDHGWYDAQSEARVQVRTLAPGGVPVAAHGEVVVSRVRYGGAHHDEVTEDEEKHWDAETGPDGRLAFTYPLPGEGQYHVAFRTHDSWQQEVQGNAVFWVCGPKFDGRLYRFNELEVVSDRRSYRVGDTAHLLVNTAEDDARLLFADRTWQDTLEKYRFVDVPGRSRVIDVVIGEDCVPSMYVEATLVRNGRVRTEVCELIVPPEQSLLHVSVRTDKPAYQPGEKGTIHIEATGPDGKPAQGQVTLTAFDKAVTYIDPESEQLPVGFFGAQRDDHEVAVESSFEQEFEAVGGIDAPENISFYNRAAPEGWDGDWKIGAGLPETPLLRAVGEGRGSNGDERVIVTGSNIPTATEVGTPRFTKQGDVPQNGVVGGVPATANASTTVMPDSHAVGRAGSDEPRKKVDPAIRSKFADTALWLPALKLDDRGTADAEIIFPESLTTWRVHGYALNAATQTGDAATEAATSKKLLVRLLAPRFFTERDEATLSAAVNNYLPEAQDVTAELIVPAAQCQPVAETSDPAPAADADGNLHLTAHASVAPNTEHRFDWPVRLVRPGLATITVKALTMQESDGMRLAFPVEIHGLDKAVVQTGSLRAGPEETRTLHIDVPAKVDPEKTRLEITLSPSLAGVMIDALPYLADYPYGCVEQTVSRFYPSVLVRDTLRRLGTDLETVGNQRRQMNPADLNHRFGESPVYDSARLDRMIREGLQSLYNAQVYASPGTGWGWWAHDEEPSLFQTAYVLQGLHAAKVAGVKLDDSVYNNGFKYLEHFIDDQLAKPKRKQVLGDTQTQAYLAYVLSLERSPDDQARESKWLDRLYARRGELNNYGRALLALALHQTGRNAQAQTVLRNLLQFVERNDGNETAWVRTPSEGWWFWWNNDIETNAWALKALVALDPKNDLAPRLVKWLLNNRRGGSYWRGTRDTAQVISAMTDYLLASGEGAPDDTLSVSIDGQTVREVHVTKDNLFTFDNRVRLEGLQLRPGPHEIALHRQGAGALYYACSLTYFTREEGVKEAGGDLTVERTYTRLVPKVITMKSPGSDATAQRAGFTRVPLKDGDELTSGEEIEVSLKINAKNTYDYLAFEDRKPAGCEPVELRSGQRWADGFCDNVELRDTKTVFFVSLLEQGEHTLNYRLRAETPGTFHALPATGAALYAPEIRANSDEMRLRVAD